VIGESVSVRLATADDVVAMSRVLIASITELCGADHHDDPKLIAGWTRNKTPVAVREMLANPTSSFYVAERDGEVAAVGCIRADGEIGLNYVAPEHRFHGVSKALLATMEAALRAKGFAVARLDSTATAHRFYLATGWVDDDRSGAGHTVASYPMRKRL